MVSLISNFHMHLIQTFVVMEVSPESVRQTLMEEGGKMNCWLAQVEGEAKMKLSLGAAGPWTVLTSMVRDLLRKGSMTRPCYY